MIHRCFPVDSAASLSCGHHRSLLLLEDRTSAQVCELCTTRALLRLGFHALRSYQYGNYSSTMAQLSADLIEAALNLEAKWAVAE